MSEPTLCPVCYQPYYKEELINELGESSAWEAEVCEHCRCIFWDVADAYDIHTDKIYRNKN